MTTIAPSTKRCTGCDRVQQIQAFHRDRSSPDGRYTRCKTCRAAYDARRYRDHRDLILTRNATWKAANRDRIIARRAAVRDQERTAGPTVGPGPGDERAPALLPRAVVPGSDGAGTSELLRYVAGLLVDAAGELEAVGR